MPDVTLIDNPDEDVLKLLMSLPPSSVDLEMRSLSLNFDDENLHNVDDDDAILQLRLTSMLDVFGNLLATNCGLQNFEVTQAYLNLFLKIYKTELSMNAEHVDKVRSLKELHKQQWSHLENYFHSTLSLVDFFRGSF